MATKDKPRRRILIRSIAAFFANDLTITAASVSYFSMLALFPTLLLALAIGNRIIGQQTVETYVIKQVLAYLPGAQGFVRRNLESFSTISPGVIISCVMVMVWAASWMFTAIERALNRIWGTYPRSFLHGRAVNLALMTLVWAILAGSALFTTFMSGLRTAADRIPINLTPGFTALFGFAWQTGLFLVGVVVTIMLFAVLYKVMPNTEVPFWEALPGAALAGTLWEGAKFGFAYLLPFFHYDMLYGSIGAGVAILTWVYVSSIIMLFGAQFTALLHRDHLFNASYRRKGAATGDLPVAVNE